MPESPHPDKRKFLARFQIKKMPIKQAPSSQTKIETKIHYSLKESDTVNVLIKKLTNKDFVSMLIAKLGSGYQDIGGKHALQIIPASIYKRGCEFG